MNKVDDIKGDVDRDLEILEVKVLSYIEQCFWEQGGVPANELVASALGLSVKRVEECWNLRKFRAGIVARGINLANAEISEGILDPRQILLANLLMNTMDRRSMRQKLEECNVTQQQYNGWMRQPAFLNYMRKRAEEQFKSSDPVAYLSFLQNVERGNMEAIKMFFEMRGIYSPKITHDVNLDSIMIRVVEILTKFLTPDQLAAAASELEGVMPQRGLGTGSDDPIDISSSPRIGKGLEI